MYRSGKEGILVVWGILSSGKKILLSMMLGNKERYEDWLEVFRDFLSETDSPQAKRRRGLGEPVLGTTDGAPGLIKTFEQLFPETLRQRCLVHKKRNILNKVPQEATRGAKVYLDSIYYAPDYATAKLLTKEFKDKYNQKYPSVVKLFEEDFGANIQHLKCPVGHRRSKPDKLVERSFLEEKRRSKQCLDFL